MLHPKPDRLWPALWTSAMLAIVAVPLTAQGVSKPLQAKPAAASQPGELGKVAWLRDEVVAQAQAKKSGKPVLVLFQEVPG